MKLTKLHLFFILLFVLVFGSFINKTFMEGLTDRDDDKDDDKKKYFSSYGGDDGLMRNLEANTLWNAGETQNVSSSPSPAPAPTIVPAATALPKGIPGSAIPSGDNDLYILKTQIVPPVCPACPNVGEQKCQPCPSCARCPEPAFECKKVPNYNSTNSQYLPKAVLNDFSTFGM